MHKWIVYAAGGIACLGIGAYFYTVLPAAPAPRMPREKQNIAITDLANKLAGKIADTNAKTSPAPLPEPPPAPTATSVIFAGDIMLGRDVAAAIKTKGPDYPFAKIKDTVGAANFAIANLEGPLTLVNNDPTNRMRFHFDPALAPALVASGFDAFSLANNHGLDQGQKGLIDTEMNLKAAGLNYFGDPAIAGGNVYQFMAGDKKVSVLGFQMVYGKLDPTGYAQAIAAAKKDADYVIVMPHWGVEYKHDANQTQKDYAHQFIDAGADLVVGSHPHVIEGAEVYKGKPIFYSLGNLVFDQYFSADTQEGMMIRLNFAGDKETIDLLPYAIPTSQPIPVEDDKKAKMLKDMAAWSQADLKDQIISGSLSF